MSLPAVSPDFLSLAFSPEFQADPYPRFNELRARDPVHRTPSGYWLLTRHRDVAAVVRDPRLSSDERHRDREPRATDRPGSAGSEFDDGLMVFLDPPDHTRIRGLVSKAFTARRIERLRPRIVALVDELLGSAAARGDGRLEVVADLAEPLPVVVICELLGVPAVDRERFRTWSRDLSALVDLQPMRTPEQERAIDAAASDFAAYFASLVDYRRRNPADDLLTALIGAEQDGEKLSERELRDTAMFLLIAGHETTINLIGNGVLALLDHPDELARLRDDPSVARTAIDELLRFDSPVQLTQRITLGEYEIAGVKIPAGQTLIPLLGAANRDPGVFETPDRLDLAREGAHRHLAFGGGRHYCLGASLARLEAEAAIGGLVRRFSSLELADEPRRRRTFTLRGLESLPVAIAIDP